MCGNLNKNCPIDSYVQSIGSDIIRKCDLFWGGEKAGFELSYTDTMPSVAHSFSFLTINEDVEISGLLTPLSTSILPFFTL